MWLLLHKYQPHENKKNKSIHLKYKFTWYLNEELKKNVDIQKGNG